MINPLLFSLVLVLIVIVIIKINIDSNNKESESFDNMPISKKVIYNIIPTFDNQYLASFMPNSSDNNNLIITRSLKSNTWKGPLKNSSPDDKTIIVDLSYDKDKRLLGFPFIEMLGGTYVTAPPGFKFPEYVLGHEVPKQKFIVEDGKPKTVDFIEIDGHPNDKGHEWIFQQVKAHYEDLYG